MVQTGKSSSKPVHAEDIQCPGYKPLIQFDQLSLIDPEVPVLMTTSLTSLYATIISCHVRKQAQQTQDLSVSDHVSQDHLKNRRRTSIATMQDLNFFAIWEATHVHLQLKKLNSNCSEKV